VFPIFDHRSNAGSSVNKTNDIKKYTRHARAENINRTNKSGHDVISDIGAAGEAGLISNKRRITRMSSLGIEKPRKCDKTRVQGKIATGRSRRISRPRRLVSNYAHTCVSEENKDRMRRWRSSRRPAEWRTGKPEVIVLPLAGHFEEALRCAGMVGKLITGSPRG